MNEKFKSLGRALSRSEQRKVMGGLQPGGNCQAQFPTEYGYTTATGLSAADAKLNAEANHTHWCCDHCCTATWADHTGCPQQP